MCKIIWNDITKSNAEYKISGNAQADYFEHNVTASNLSKTGNFLDKRRKQ